jgi:hypothetical protein
MDNGEMDKDWLDRLHQIVNLVCADLSTPEKLDLLSAAWLLVASNARTERLAEPDGFPTERAHQVERLRAFAEMIALDEPDLETERLWHEGNYQEMVQRQHQQLQQLLDEKPRDEQDEGGEAR